MSPVALILPLRLSSRATASCITTRLISSCTISALTHAERTITGKDSPTKNGPVAAAQKHVGERLTPAAVSDITQGEKNVIGEDTPVPGGPAAMAQGLSEKVPSMLVSRKGKGSTAQTVIAERMSVDSER